MPNTFTFSPHYGSRAGIEGWFGTGNLAAWADLNANGSATEITAQIEKGLTYADSIIDWIATEFRLTVPLTSSALGTSRYNLLVWLANELAGSWLYFERGQLDDGNRDKMQIHRDHAEGSIEKEWRDGMIYRLLSGVEAGSGNSLADIFDLKPAGGRFNSAVVDPCGVEGVYYEGQCIAAPCYYPASGMLVVLN
jgi:hypothetical protein